MEGRYSGFKDLPADVAKRLEKRIADAMPKLKIPKDVPIEESMRLIEEHHRDRIYSEKELEEIVDAFSVFNNAVLKGLPNQLYGVMIKTLDSKIGRMAYASYAIWCAYEGEESAKEEVQSFADWIKAEIDRRAGWTTGQFNDEYCLKHK